LSRRVVVTGIGLVSSLGIGTGATWDALLSGTSGVTRITRFDVSAYAAQIAAEVKGFDPLQFIEKKEVKKMDLFIQYAIAAAQFAMDDSKLQITDALGAIPDDSFRFGRNEQGNQNLHRWIAALTEANGPQRSSQ